MAKRYDPILCMMVDEPTKAQDELKIKKEDGLWCVYKDGKVVGQSNSEAGALRLYRMFESKAQDAMPGDLKKAGYEVGTVEKYGSTYYTLVYNGKVISTSPTEANIVEKAKKHYANRHAKARDVSPATQRYINTIVDESKSNAEKFVRQAEQDDEVPENELKYVYKAYNEKFGYKFHDSASALDKAISTCDAASKADMDYWVGRYEKGCKSLIDAIKQGRSPIKTVQKAKQVISQDYDSHWKYLKDAFASYVVSTAKEEAKGDLSGMIDNTSKVEKREWKEFADREKKLMKAKNDALKSAEQAFK